MKSDVARLPLVEHPQYVTAELLPTRTAQLMPPPNIGQRMASSVPLGLRGNEALAECRFGPQQPLNPGHLFHGQGFVQIGQEVGVGNVHVRVPPGD